MQAQTQTLKSADAVNADFGGLILRHSALIVFVLALAASITGIRNGFAYDDVPLILRDNRIHDVADAWRVFTQPYWTPEYGGSLYRPLTSLAFALQWAIGGGSPMLFHIASIVIYGAACVALYFLARQLFSEKAALLGAAIFAVHPLHVEVVANSVGQAELASALLILVSLAVYAKWLRAGVIRPTHIAAICAMYGAALMFKESAIIMPALLLGLDLHLVRGESTAARYRRCRLLASGLIIVSVAFVALRTAVLGEVAGGGRVSEVFAGLSIGQRAWTALGIAPEWVRLFVWPATLSADYSSPAIRTITEFELEMLPVIALIAGLCALAVYARKRREATTYALVWVAIAMIIPTNVIVVTGVTFAERLLFLPSIGVAMLLGQGLTVLAAAASEASRRLIVATAVLLLAAGIARSSTRNPVWKDNETLFRQTVLDAPLSWRAHLLLGELLVGQGKGEGIYEMTIGTHLSPKENLKVRYITAHRFHRVKQFSAALPFYRESIALAPSNPRIRDAAALCLIEAGQLPEARAVAMEGLRLNPGDERLERVLSLADSVAARPGLLGERDSRDRSDMHPVIFRDLGL